LSTSGLAIAGHAEVSRDEIMSLLEKFALRCGVGKPAGERRTQTEFRRSAACLRGSAEERQPQSVRLSKGKPRADEVKARIGERVAA